VLSADMVAPVVPREVSQICCTSFRLAMVLTVMPWARDARSLLRGCLRVYEERNLDE